MNKTYKIKSPINFFIAHVIFILALSYPSLNRANMQMFIGVYLALLIWYVFSHKFVVDYNSKRIIEKAFGFNVKHIVIDDIREYFIRETPKMGLIKNNSLDCLVSLRLNSPNGEVLKQVIWNISQDDARDVFTEAAKINSNIISAEVSFYDNVIYKNHQTKYLVIILVPLVIIFIVYFMHVLNQGLNP